MPLHKIYAHFLYTIAQLGGSRIPRLKIREEEEHNKSQVQLPSTYQKLYVLLYRACSLYVLIDCVLYIVQCSKQPTKSLLCGYKCLRVPQRVRQIQHQLQAAQESTRLVEKGRGHP